MGNKVIPNFVCFLCKIFTFKVLVFLDTEEHNFFAYAKQFDLKIVHHYIQIINAFCSNSVFN